MQGEQLKTLRQHLGLNQTDFWRRVGVSQCTGSRYELGRLVPTPVRLLIGLAYGSDKEREAILDRLGVTDDA